MKTRVQGKARGALVLGALVGGLAGCALSKPPEHAEVVQQALAPGTKLPSAWTAQPGASAADVGGGWLKTFHDPGLEAVVTEAIARNIDLRAAAAVVQMAQASVRVAGSHLWPHVNGKLGAGTSFTEHRDGRYDATQVFGDVSWEVDVWGRVRAEKAASYADYESVALDYAFARQSLAATTGKAWYQAIEARQLLELAGQSVGVYQELYVLVKRREDAGKVSDLDVAQASANLNDAQSERAKAQGAYGEARRALELLLGRYPAAEIAIAQTFAPLPPPVGAGIPSALLTRRPDLLAAERKVLQAFRLHEAAKLSLLPRFTLALEAGRLIDSVLTILQINPWMAHGAVGADIPIFQGGKLQAQIHVASAQQAQAIAAYGSVVLSAFGEVENALMDEHLTIERLKIGENALSDRNVALKLVRVRFDAGSVDLLSVLQIQAAQIASQSNVIKLRSAGLANRIDLHLALGGSFDMSPASQ